MVTNLLRKIKRAIFPPPPKAISVNGYSDAQLHEHEEDFWVNSWDDAWRAKVEVRLRNYLHPFFDFDHLEEPILEVGSGGLPLAHVYPQYNDVLLIDPLHAKLAATEKLSFLRDYRAVSGSFLDWTPDRQYRTLIAFNCIDHFNEAETRFFAKAHEALAIGGRVMVYYHLRNSHRDMHLALDQKVIDQSIAKYFHVEKFSDAWDPDVRDWVEECRRYVLVKK